MRLQLNQHFSLKLLANISSAISALHVFTFQLSLVSSFPRLHCNSFSALPKHTLRSSFPWAYKNSLRAFLMRSEANLKQQNPSNHTKSYDRSV